MIDLKQAVEMAKTLVIALYPNVLHDSVLVEEIENGGDHWTVSMSFSVPLQEIPPGASGYAQIIAGLRGPTVRRTKRFNLDPEGNMISMKDVI